jgi:hypothetical protein
VLAPGGCQGSIELKTRRQVRYRVRLTGQPGKRVSKIRLLPS